MTTTSPALRPSVIAHPTETLESPVFTASRAAIVGTLAIATGSFALSYTALSDLAAHNGTPAALSWVVPLIVDSMVLVATLAVVALTEGRWFAWLLLALSAGVSVAGNVVHASQFGVVGMVIAAVPPVMLLASVHLAVVLARPSRSTAGRGIKPVWISAPVGPTLAEGFRARMADTSV